MMKLWLCKQVDYTEYNTYKVAATWDEARKGAAKDYGGLEYSGGAADFNTWDATEVVVPNYDIHLTPKRNPHVYLKGIGPRTVHLDARTGLHYINIFGLQRVVEPDGDGWRFTGEPLPEPPAPRIIKKGGK